MESLKIVYVQENEGDSLENNCLKIEVLNVQPGSTQEEEYYDEEGDYGDEYYDEETPNGGDGSYSFREVS